MTALPVTSGPLYKFQAALLDIVVAKLASTACWFLHEMQYDLCYDISAAGDKLHMDNFYFLGLCCAYIFDCFPYVDSRLCSCAALKSCGYLHYSDVVSCSLVNTK